VMMGTSGLWMGMQWSSRYRCHTLIKCVSRCAGSVLNQAVSGCSGKLNYINYINHLFKDITKC
jgi:hypothetical protein